MLPRPNRLRRRDEFQATYRRGRSWAHPLLALHVLPRREGMRVGVTVSKKVGGAVVRNRVRRRLRQAIRLRLPQWRSGFDLVVVARTAAAEASFDALGSVIDELAKRGRLVREPDDPPGAQFEGWTQRDAEKTGAKMPRKGQEKVDTT
jgi:ribonuclease P protein component